MCFFFPHVSYQSVRRIKHWSCCLFPGASNRHVQAHESTGWSENYGGNQEGDQLRCPAAGQLLWQDTGENQTADHWQADPYLIHMFCFQIYSKNSSSSDDSPALKLLTAFNIYGEKNTAFSASSLEKVATCRSWYAVLLSLPPFWTLSCLKSQVWRW